MVLASMVYNFFDKETPGANTFALRARWETLIRQNKSKDVNQELNQESDEEVHKSIIRKIKKRKE